MSRSWSRRTFLKLATLGVSAGPSLAAPHVSPRAPRETLAVLPFKIAAPAGTSQPAETSERVQALAQTATERAARAAVRRGLARKTERPADRPGAGSLDGLVLTGEIRIPANLTQEEAGTRAAFRKGDFAFAVVRLENGGGKLLSEASVKLRWNEVRWLRGARTRQARPVADVLADAVEKLMDRGVARLSIEQSND